MWGLPAQASGSVGGLGRCLFARTLLHCEAARSRRSVDTECSDKKEAPAYILSSSMLVDRPLWHRNCFISCLSMEAVRVQYSRSFGGYLLQTSGLLRASRLKRTRQGEKKVWQGRKKSFPRLKKRPAGLKKRFPGLKKSFEVEKKLSRVEKKLFPQNVGFLVLFMAAPFFRANSMYLIDPSSARSGRHETPLPDSRLEQGLSWRQI